MHKNPWMWVALFGLLVFALTALMGLSADRELEKSLLGYFDALVSFVVGGGSGIAAGAGLALIRQHRPAAAQPKLTGPLVASVGIVVCAMVLMFAWTAEPTLRNQIVSYAGALMPFVVGAGVGTMTGRAMV